MWWLGSIPSGATWSVKIPLLKGSLNFPLTRSCLPDWCPTIRDGSYWPHLRGSVAVRRNTLSVSSTARHCQSQSNFPPWERGECLSCNPCDNGQQSQPLLTCRTALGFCMDILVRYSLSGHERKFTKTGRNSRERAGSFSHRTCRRIYAGLHEWLRVFGCVQSLCCS